MLIGSGLALLVQSAGASASPSDLSFQQYLFNLYCLVYHNEALLEAGSVPVDFEGLDLTNVAAEAELWEIMVRKICLNASEYLNGIKISSTPSVE